VNEAERPSLQALLRRLVSHSALYGAADVFVNAVNFFLLPLYTAFLTAEDYGALGLLTLFGTVAKIVFRLGLDAGFFRTYYDLPEGEDRRCLAGSCALFAALIGGMLLAGVVLWAPQLTRLLFSHSRPPLSWVVLTAADVYLSGFAFVPQALLRVRDRPGLFSAFAGGRHLVNILLKIILLTRGWGVTGALWSDLIASGVFALIQLPILWGGARWSLSWRLLKPALAFGLPKVPHGFLIQVQNLADRKILDLFVSQAQLGVYQICYGFGSGVKFASSAFEPAWGPFIYSEIKKPDAPRTLARVITYAFGAFSAVGLAVAVLARELLVLMTPRRPEVWPGAPLVPVVVLAYLLHGFFLLTSIGIGIERKARYYPLVTLAAATTNLVANFLLIPRWGIMGAAWATVVSYFVMTALGLAISQRLYPTPLETGRLLRLAGTAALVFALSRLVSTGLWSALAAKCALLLAFPGLLLASGFLNATERAWLRSRWDGRKAAV